MASLTVGFIPREKFSVAEASLARLLASDLRFQLLLVDPDIPEPYRSRLLGLIEGRGDATVLKAPRHSTTFAMANACLEVCDTDYFGWVENDILLERDALGLLRSACEEMPADVAVPTIIERFEQFERLHFDEYLGFFEPVSASTSGQLRMVPRDFSGVFDVDAPRSRLDMLETHCVLFRAPVARSIYPFDAQLALSEEVDLSLALRKVGARIVVEPRCRVVFVAAPLVEAEEREFFGFRWNLERGVGSQLRITQKWGLVNIQEALDFARTKLDLLDCPSVDDQVRHERQERSLVEAASRDLEGVIPVGAPLILVDDQQVDATDLAQGRRVYPFLERDGFYDGPPADSATAIEHLERLRHDGARFFVIAWPSFWWIETYPGLMAYLRQRYRCVLESARLVVFSFAR